MAVDLEGTNDYINCGSGATIDNIFDAGGSIACWVKSDAIGAETQDDVLAKVGATTGWVLALRNFAASGNEAIQFYVYWSGGAAGDGNWRTADSIFAYGVWFHVVITYNASAAANDPILYLNGLPTAWTGLDTNPTGTARDSDAAESLFVGARVGPANLMDGQVEDVRAFTRVLTADEAAILAAGYRGPLGGEVLWLPIDGARAIAHFDGAALAAATNYLNDMSGNGNHGDPAGNPLGFASDCPRLGGITD